MRTNSQADAPTRVYRPRTLTKRSDSDATDSMSDDQQRDERPEQRSSERFERREKTRFSSDSRSYKPRTYRPHDSSNDQQADAAAPEAPKHDGFSWSEMPYASKNIDERPERVRSERRDDDRRPFRSNDRFERRDDDRRPFRSNDRFERRDDDRRPFRSNDRFERRDDDRRPFRSNNRFERRDDDRRPFRSNNRFERRDDDRRPFRSNDRFEHRDDDRRPFRSNNRFEHRDDDRRPFRSNDRFERRDDDRRPFRSNDRFGKAKFGQRFEEAKPRSRKKVFDFSNDTEPETIALKPAMPPINEADAAQGLVRLNKYIANSGLCSRREADEYIQNGQITVNGEVVSTLGAKVNSTDEICFKGKKLESERRVYIVMNKPKDYVTTVDDPHAAHTVMELLEGACSERIYPVGRLDRNSTGVLLFTNDGDLTKKLTHPSFRKRKIYQVTLDRKVSEADLETIFNGIELDGERIEVDAIDYTANSDGTEVGIEIHSGQNRVVRRLFESLNYRVDKLDRVYFAGLTKKNLPRGTWRFLEPKEISMLKMGRF